MTVDAIREYCLGKGREVTEGLPFGEDVVVFKVREKIFLLLSLDVHPQTFNVKCDPERAIDLRERYESVQPGYHMNKKHWNTVVLDGSIPPREIKAMIDHSYELVSRVSGKSVVRKRKKENAIRKKS